MEGDGADADVVGAIEASIAAIGDLETYRGEMESYGRDLVNITQDSRLDLGLRADVDTTPVDAYDAQFGFRMVEFDASLAKQVQPKQHGPVDSLQTRGRGGHRIRAVAVVVIGKSRQHSQRCPDFAIRSASPTMKLVVEPVTAVATG